MRFFSIAKPLVLFSTLSAVSACGGSSTPVATRGIDITNYAADFTALTTQFPTSRSLPDTAVADLPVSGTGEYDGRLLLETNGEPAAVGALALDVAFAPPGERIAVTGTISDFLNANDAPLPGEIVLEGDMMAGTSSFTLFGAGSLTVESGAVFAYVMGLNGGFKNPAADLAGGTLNGEATNNGGATVRAVRGQFVVEAFD